MQKVVWEAGKLCEMFILLWNVFPPALFFLVFTPRRGSGNNWLYNLWSSFQHEKMQSILLKIIIQALGRWLIQEDACLVNMGT